MEELRKETDKLTKQLEHSSFKKAEEPHYIQEPILSNYEKFKVKNNRYNKAIKLINEEINKLKLEISCL